MAERLNRDPTYDLGRHIATGQKGPFSGQGISREMDQELDRNDPMDEWTRPDSINRLTTNPGDAQDINRANAAGLSSDDAMKDGQRVDVEAMSEWSDEPVKGGLTYGPRNTGDYRG
jgi:hypothetical protein